MFNYFVQNTIYTTSNNTTSIKRGMLILHTYNKLLVFPLYKNQPRTSRKENRVGEPTAAAKENT